MSTAEKRSFTLPAEQAAYIDRLVEAGAYASASEVVQAGIEALRVRDANADRWLQEDVAPVYDAMEANPDRAVPAEDVFAAVRARHAERLKGTM